MVIGWDSVAVEPPEELPGELQAFVDMHPCHKMERLVGGVYDPRVSPIYGESVMRISMLVPVVVKELVPPLLIDGHRLNNPMAAYHLLVDAIKMSPRTAELRTRMLWGSGDDEEEVTVVVRKKVKMYQQGMWVVTGIVVID